MKEPLPLHVEDTVRSVAEIQAEHHRRATPFEQRMRSAVGFVGSAPFVVGVTAGITVWLAVNLVLRLSGHRPIDPLPFYGLQGVITVAAFYVTLIILATQRRESRLSEARAQLTLQVAAQTELKASKTIELIMELRRDAPAMPNRSDEAAEEMTKTSDPKHVLDALAEAQERLTGDD